MFENIIHCLYYFYFTILKLKKKSYSNNTFTLIFKDNISYEYNNKRQKSTVYYTSCT